MKKILFMVLMAASIGVSAQTKVQKTGIAEFDNLQYSKGKTVFYFDQEGIDSKKKNRDSVIERKIFKNKNSYIVADYDLKKRPVLIYETNDDASKLTDLTINGYRVSYYENGKIQHMGRYKNNKQDGDHIAYREDGKVVITTYKNGKKVK